MDRVYCDIHNHGETAPFQLTSVTPDEFTAGSKISSKALHEILSGLADPSPLKKAAERLIHSRYTAPVSMGIHPWYLDTRHSAEDRLKLMDYLADTGAIAAIGECGLDRRKSSFSLEQQKDLFEKQIRIAENFSLPVIIHNVRCLPDVLSLRKKYRKTSWIIHGFIGNDAEIRQCLRLNIILSPGIALLLMNNIQYHKMYDSLHTIPDESMFFETDGVNVNIEKIYGIAAQYTGRSTEVTAEIMLRHFRSLLLHQNI